MTSREAYEIAQWFHAEYEHLAPSFNWTTQEASRVKWDDLPDNQRHLMCQVVENMLEADIIRRGDG